MRESELKKLFFTPAQHERAKDLKIFQNITNGFIGEKNGVLKFFLKSEGTISGQLGAAIKDIAEKREDIDLLKKIDRNDEEGHRRAKASMFKDPIGDYVQKKLLDPLLKILGARKGEDIQILREAIQGAQSLRDSVVTMVKKEAVEQGYPEPIATSDKVKTREQAIRELGLGK